MYCNIGDEMRNLLHIHTTILNSFGNQKSVGRTKKKGLFIFNKYIKALYVSMFRCAWHNMCLKKNFGYEVWSRLDDALCVDTVGIDRMQRLGLCTSKLDALSTISRPEPAPTPPWCVVPWCEPACGLEAKTFITTHDLYILGKFCQRSLTWLRTAEEALASSSLSLQSRKKGQKAFRGYEHYVTDLRDKVAKSYGVFVLARRGLTSELVLNVYKWL